MPLLPLVAFVVGIAAAWFTRLVAIRIAKGPLALAGRHLLIDTLLIATAVWVAASHAPSVAAGVGGVAALMATQIAAHVDRAYRVIPNALTYRLPFVLAGLTAVSVAIDRTVSGVWLALVFALIAPVLLYSISAVYARFTGLHGFGMGDIKLVISVTFGVGLWGSQAVVVYAYATFVSAALISSLLLVTGRASRSTRVAFAPFFVVGVATAVGLLPLLVD